MAQGQQQLKLERNSHNKVRDNCDTDKGWPEGVTVDV